MNSHHQEILLQIQQQAGTPTQHTFLDSYLGNTHPRYAIDAPALRKIAKDWMLAHRDLSPKAFAAVLTSLIKGKSSTEKFIAGMLMDRSTREQRTFDPKLFDGWLDHLIGWAEVDSVCTGDYTITAIPLQWNVWGPLLRKFSKSKNIQKRRASIVLLCSPLRRHADEHLAAMALENVDRLKSEKKEVLITKAISWVLRSMEKHHRKVLTAYLDENKDSLPKIAVRETLMKLKTGKKTKKKNG